LLGPLLCLLPLGGFAPLAVLSVPLMAMLALQIARRAFGGIGGDIIGAAGEATRTMILVVVSGMI
jgi:cobalamin synthase